MDDLSGYHSCDVAGIGFGPAGIALAAAIDDWAVACGGRAPLRARFFERRSASGWHPDFILDGTDINHHFLRDLATPRDPRSRFTFANYLKHKGRLYDFGLLGRPASRREWSDYVTWVTDQLQAYVAFGEPVQRIEPVFHDGGLAAFDVATSASRVRATNLVICTGAEPFVPECFRPLLGSRVFHTCEFLPRIARLPPSVERIVVIGGGQSAGEAIFDLRQRFPATAVIGVQRAFGFKLYDLGHFSNQVFGPSETDYFYHLPDEAKDAAFAETVRTNYAGLDFQGSSALYGQVYEDRVAGTERISLLNRRRVTGARDASGRLQIELVDVYTGKRETVDADAVVLATGYSSRPIPSLLASLEPYVLRTETGSPLVGRDYRLQLDDHGPARVYLNGLCERSHGIGDGQSFSLVAVRAEAILDSLLRPNLEVVATPEDQPFPQLAPGHA